MDAKQKRILKHSSKDLPRIDMFVKAPNEKEKRAKFSIIERRFDGDRTINKSIKNSTLDSINNRFQEKKISFEEARILCKELISTLVPKTAILHNDANLRLLQEYWNAEYAEKDISAPKAAYNRLVRAVSAIGHYSLQAASREEMQKQLDSTLKGNKHRTIVAAINQILSYLKRGFKLRKAREEVRVVSYLTEQEFKQLLQVLPDSYQEVFKVAFSTGCRLGEIFAIQPEDIGEGLKVRSQIDESLSRRETKNRQERTAFILKGYRESVISWANKPEEDRLKLRNLAWSKITRKACAKAKLTKKCVFHDLRHSYAIYLISKGISLSLVSQFLGNSIHVAEKYYAGRVAVPESIQLVSQFFD